jgi:putative ABC transport system permease protein
VAAVLEQKRGVAPANFADWKSQSFNAMAAYRWKSVDATGDAVPERLEGAQVSSEFFPMLDAKPVLGGSFAAEEEQPGHPAVILSYGIRQHRFGGDIGCSGVR